MKSSSSSSSSNSQKILPPSKQFLELNLNQSLSTFQAQCSGFLNHLSHLQSCLFSLHDRAKHSLEAGFSRSISCSFPSNKNPAWARISDNSSSSSPTTQTNLISQLGNAMSAEAIEERLAGVPVYALSNCNEEFVLVSGAKTGKSLGLMCFKKEDAEALLHQMKSMDPAMRKEGSRVVPVPLNKVYIMMTSAHIMATNTFDDTTYEYNFAVSSCSPFGGRSCSRDYFTAYSCEWMILFPWFNY